MARNASGTYALPLPDVVTGTVIQSAWANTTMNDLENEMSDSLSRSGKGSMLAALKLVDGTSAVPGLSFGLEPSTGLRRAGAGDLRAVVAGADRLQLTTALLATSGLAAADAGTDFKITTTNVRTAGKLFDIQTGGTSRFSVGPAGVTFPLAPAVFTAGLAAESDLAAASAGTDYRLGTLLTRTAGLLLDVQNGGVSRFAISPGGTVLTSQTAAADAGNDLLLNTANTRTAGALLDVQNNATSVFRVRFDGLLTAQSSLSAASGLTDFSFKTLVTRTAGLLLDVQNNGSSKFSVGPAGNVTAGATATGAPTFATNWADNGGLPSAARRSAGLVTGFLGASATGAAGAAVATLPVGFRPTYAMEAVGRWFDASAGSTYPAIFGIDVGGVITLSLYDNGAALVTPPAIAVGDGVFVFFSFAAV